MENIFLPLKANLCPSEATTYESEDETSGRRRSKRGTPLYSKQDIREQYCISDKQVHVLETTRQPPGLFGCISSRNVSIFLIFVCFNYNINGI